MKRYDCLRAIAGAAADALVVSSAGAMTLEWHALRPSDGNFRVRTLGLCSSIALGMALALPQRRVIALDGDGSLLMNLCSLPTIARMQPKNLLHIVFDNEVYEASVEELAQRVLQSLKAAEVCFIGVKVTTERTQVPPYPMDEVENKYRFIRYVEKTEQIEILKTNLPASYV